MFRSPQAPTPQQTKKVEFDSPLEELNYSLDYLESLICQSMDYFVESIRPPPLEATKPRRSTVFMESFKRLRNNQAGFGESIATATAAAASSSRTTITTPSKSVNANQPLSPPDSNKSQTTIGSSSFFNERDYVSEAHFIPMGNSRIEDFVETIRRIAELVIIGERVHAKAADDDKEGKEYMAIFETFFERQGLATITNILIGDSFDLFSHPAVIQQIEENNQETSVSTPVSKDPNESDSAIASHEDGNTDTTISRPIPIEDHTYQLLPPLAIATQAIQSVSILVQNVSRATSLFFILSNNHVNQLIDFPLDKYMTAERRRHDVGDTMRKFASPEIAELTTHFVTFLKSLAMRMNAETLQFFLRYPADMPTEEVEDIIVIDEHPMYEEPRNDGIEDEDRPLDETEETKAPEIVSDRPVSIKTVKIEFPLYERALEFCAAHQDSFVRVTAMNICLNTLRIATVIPTANEETGDDGADTGKSPDGVLHNAKALPLKERVSIAQYVCTPARVERLASPIFTKLAHLWGLLEEQFREMEGSILPNKPGDDFSKNKVARAKEKARRQKAKDAFSDTAYNIQDELLLLEDVLKVGLTSLNEQMIEMMLATFVYPLLLQPLILYFQRSPIPDEILFSDPLNDHSAGRPIGDSDATALENAIVLAPAKAAFFFLGAAFRFLSNPPLLRLLFTALFHPLSPDTAGETMIRAKADVACLNSDGKVQIRIDPFLDGAMQLSSDRASYFFGKITGKKCFSGSSVKTTETSETSCVFVLAPALAEILEFQGECAALVSRTRPNPYRKAIFRCFSLSTELSDLRPLSVMAVETAVSKFPPTFLSDILFGADLKTFQENFPRDEASHHIIANLDDRGIGGGTTSGQSRLSLGETGTGKLSSDYRQEILSALRNSIIKAIPAPKGTWRLDFDMVAARALLCIVSGDTTALLDVAQKIDQRCRQAAAFLSDIPHSVQRFGGSVLSKLLAGFDQETSKEGGSIEGAIMNMMFLGSGTSAPGVLSRLQQLKQEFRTDKTTGYVVDVFDTSSYNAMCSRCCAFSAMDADEAKGALRTATDSAIAWIQLDAYSSMLNSLVVEGETLTLPEDSAYAPISLHFASALFDPLETSKEIDVSPGEVLSLVGQLALPCVCEVSPSCAPLFSEDGARVVAQGITWQSLYLVLLGPNLILVEPDRRVTGDGRVVTKCALSGMSIEKDSADARSDTSARRLLISYESTDENAPGLFLVKESPTKGKSSRYISSLDVWFEDNKAVALAFRKVKDGIAKAKILRGRHIQDYLAQKDGSGYPRDIAIYESSD